jgi:competence protein ComEC
LLQFADGQEVRVTGHVTAERTLRAGGSGDRHQRLDVETEQIVAGNQTVEVHSGVRVSFYDKEGKEDTGTVPSRLFRYGQRLRFPVKLYPPRNFRNPGAFDYQGYLAENGIAALGSTNVANVELLPGFAGWRTELWRTRVRRNIVEKIHALWPPDQAALVDAMLLGEESFMEREMRTEFQRTGTYHVLVVSGLKVGILALVTFWLLRRLHVSDFVASAVAVLLTIAYAVLTDVGAPVWRATLMLALYLGARLLYRQRAALNTIGAAALALLIVEPTALLGASFQLSFLCVLIIMAIGLPLVEHTTQPYSRALRHLDAVSYDAAMPPQLAQFRLDLRMIAGRLERLFGKRIPLIALAGLGRALLISCEFLLISFVLQVGLALPMAYYFHRANIVGLPANILAVPLTEIILVAGMLAVALGYASLALAKAPALIAAAALEATKGSVRWLGGLRIADARVPTPEFAVILMGAVALVLAMILLRCRPLLGAAGLAALAASALWICAVPPRPRFRPGVLEVTAIDVGQGDSILLVSPRGRTLLVDAGGRPYWMHSELDIGEDVVSPYLWSRGMARLDAVAVTHAHADHIGGMGAILANFHPRQLWLGVDSNEPELRRLIEEANHLGVPVVSHKAGDMFELGGARIRILAPDAGPGGARRPNDESLAMKITYGETSVLLEGDAERQTERHIAAEQPEANLLKVAHHGSATSTIPELLAAVHPKFAVISVGARNVYGHPRGEVLARLAETGVITYRTDLNGAVTFYLDGRSVRPCVAGFH